MVSEERAASPRRLRVAFVSVGLAMASVLLAASLWTWLGARELAEAVTAGQASLLQTRYMRFTGPGRPAPTPDALERLFAEDRSLGLIHVGVYAPDRLLFGAGEPVEELGPEQIHGAIEARVSEHARNDRTIVRAAFPVKLHRGPEQALSPELEGLVPDELGPPRWPPPPPGGEPAGRPPPPGRGSAAGPPPGGPGGGPPPPGPEGKAGPPPDAPRFHFILEFEPLLADSLGVRANSSLIVGIAGALLMVLATLVFWRLSLRAEASERREAQQRQLAALGEMSAVLAHELRNPLASLKGHAQLLEERLSDPEVDPRTQKKAARVVTEARRLEDLTQGLLAFVRVGKLERAEVDPRAIVEASLADLPEDQRARVELHTDAAPERGSLDRVRLQQVLTNLIDNALQAAPDRPVEVHVRKARRACEFEVRDHGPGVPAEAREQIFEPFHTTRVRGTGLGLAVSRRIVDLHGGEIHVANHPEGGAVFTVRIPPV